MAWEPDRSLQVRMVVTLALLALLPMAFTFTMAAAFNHLIFPLAESLTEGEFGTVSFSPVIIATLTVAGLALAYYKGGDMALAETDARVVDREEAPELYGRVERLAALAEMPAPEIALIRSDAPNAFATGRSREDATVAVTTGLREALDDDELDAVLAHELAHIRNRDATVMSIAYLLPTFTFVVASVTYQVLTTFLKGLSYMHTGGSRDSGKALAVIIVLFVVTAAVTITVSAIFWIASFALFRLISQYREYSADRGSAAITGKPLALASALDRIDRRMQSLPDRDLRDLDGGAEALYIASLNLPMFNDEDDDDSILSQELFPGSHPPTADRIERLQELAGELER